MNHKEGRRPPYGVAAAFCTSGLWPAAPYFLLRRWWRVLRRSLRCFFFDMRLRRFLITEPMIASFLTVRGGGGTAQVSVAGTRRAQPGRPPSRGAAATNTDNDLF